MTERSTITQVVQLSVEITPGTDPAANYRKMQTMDITTNPTVKVDQFRPAGYKFDTVTAQQKEWVEATVKGQPTYTEMIWALASVVSNVTPTQVTAGDTGSVYHGANLWTYSSAVNAPDAPATYTVQQGSSVRAHKFTQALFTEFGLKWSREKVEMSGKMLGQALTDGITLTASPTTATLVPILGKQISVYLDPTSGALGTTKLTRVFSGEFMLANRFGPVWVVDAAQASYVATVETVPKADLKLKVEADAAGMALLGYLRSSVTYFVRVQAVGPVLGLVSGGTSILTYKATFDMAVEVVDVGQFADEQGVYAIEFSFAFVADSGWGKAFSWAIQNGIETGNL